MLRWGEAVLGVLAEDGTGPRGRVGALCALRAHVSGGIRREPLGVLPGAGTAVAALPPAESPCLTGTARPAPSPAPDAGVPRRPGAPPARPRPGPALTPRP
ncbi:hypothetical protein ABZZ17_15050 [Streptomyces sp. NPDC006512]|uniref:hypothetical protein n=1 Tax=Streptomyces sp. NPDC006512 TaxID=3154307 RepID=UPI0033A1F497